MAVKLIIDGKEITVESNRGHEAVYVLNFGSGTVIINQIDAGASSENNIQIGGKWFIGGVSSPYVL